MHVLFWKLPDECFKIHSYNLLTMLKKKPLTIEMKPLPNYIMACKKELWGKRPKPSFQQKRKT